MTDFDPQDFPALRAELHRMAEPGFTVPPELDEAILSKARQAYHARRRAWRRVQRIGAGLAAAAVIALAVRIFLPGSPWMAPPVQRPQLTRAADINGDGRVDILDAFTVARRLARHEPTDPAWDINGDGVVDQKDVDLIAHMAVQVGQEKPQ